MTESNSFTWKLAPRFNWESIKPFIEKAMLTSSIIIVNETKEKASGPSLPKPKTRRKRSSSISKSEQRHLGKSWRVRVLSGRYRQTLSKVGKWSGRNKYQVAIGSPMSYGGYVEKNTANITQALISEIPKVEKKLKSILRQQMESGIRIN